MKLSKVSITTDGVLSRLLVDGVDMSHAMSVTYTHRGGDIPRLTIVLPVEAASVESTVCINNEKCGHTAGDGMTARSISTLLVGK